MINAEISDNTISSHSSKLTKNRFISSSVIYGLLTLVVNKTQHSKCYEDLEQLHEGINRKEIWAMKSNFDFDNQNKIDR